MMNTFPLPAADALTAARVSYDQATPPQRALALLYLRQCLDQHFPTLAARTWADALALFRPDLLLLCDQVRFSDQDLIELAQHLADSPELPQLDPPLYAPPALHLAQQYLHAAELAIWSLPELETLAAGASPRLYALVSYLARSHQLAEQVVQARRWGLVVGRPLPPGMPGVGPALGSPELERRLQQLRLPSSRKCA